MMLWALVLAHALAGPRQRIADFIANQQAAAYQAIDANMVANINSYRTAAASGEGSAVLNWGGMLQAALTSGSLTRGAITIEQDVEPFLAAVPPAAANTPALAADLYAVGALIQQHLGRTDEATAMATASVDAGVNIDALKLVLAAQPADAAATCSGILSRADGDIQRFSVLDTCRPAAGLDWASRADQTFYSEEQARRAASQAAHAAEQQAQWAAQAQAQAAASQPSSSSSSSSAPAAPSSVSVRLHVTCSEKVRLFEGSSPTSGGTYGWQSSNSVSSRSMRPGDVLCICDERDRQQSCWTAGSQGASLDIGCGGFIAR